ncbi:MAG TPA: HEAT repeat domain-containing protein, partial [bacterium]
VPSERAPLGAPERQRPVPATVRPAPAAPRTPPPDAATIAAAIERLARENPMERELAQKQLRAAGAAAVPALINALEDENAPARRAAIAVLGQIRDPRAAEPLAALLGTSSTPTWNVLSGAFRALGGEAAPALVDALGSGDDIARSRAAELMGAIADPRFADPLIERLNRDRHSGVRVKIAEALGRIGERSACEALLVMLDEP